MGAKWFYYFLLYNFVFDLQIYMTAPNILIFLLTATTNNYLIFLNILAFIFIPQSGVTTTLTPFISQTFCKTMSDPNKGLFPIY